MDYETIKVGVRGRITIPKSIREKHKIKHLDKYKIYMVSDVIILEKYDKSKEGNKIKSLEEYMK
ncbi:MAG: AbrB/MazE/SpoVT family DNA-binding domain-containing protein [Candidatus Methanofastidiosa archaeon]|nr:AbrB/MazE/SpoVT family DNA-binding domain-containing protein [Candidatus Methanofastidiosa archaeon]